MEKRIKHPRWRPIKTRAALILVIVGIFAGAAAACFLSSTPLHAALAEPEITALYNQGTRMFQEADAIAETDPEKAQTLYRNAVMRFQRIANEGNIHNGKLCYNIGNIYFRLKDIGRAILNYRRAQLYTLNDENLQNNLDAARANRVDHIEEKQKTRILKTLVFWHYDFSTRTRVFIFASVFMLLWIFATIRLFYRKPFTLWVISSAAVLSLMFASSLLTEHILLQKNRPGVIITPQVTARKGNSNTYEPSFKEPLHAGTEFTLIGTRGEWYHIELPDSRRCWVPGAALELIR